MMCQSGHFSLSSEKSFPHRGYRFPDQRPRGPVLFGRWRPLVFHACRSARKTRLWFSPRYWLSRSALRHRLSWRQSSWPWYPRKCGKHGGCRRLSCGPARTGFRRPRPCTSLPFGGTGRASTFAGWAHLLTRQRCPRVPCDTPDIDARSSDDSHKLFYEASCNTPSFPSKHLRRNRH
jgi:hypothetical protein